MHVKTAMDTIFKNLDENYAKLINYLEKDGTFLNKKLSNQDAWSILEHIEHTYLTSYFLLLTLNKTIEKVNYRKQSTSFTEEVGDLTKINEVSLPNLFEWNPPSHMIPNKKYSKHELKTLLETQKQSCLNLLQKITDGSGTLCKVSMSVQNLGKLDAYQWAYFLTQHAKYHVKYIELIEGES